MTYNVSSGTLNSTIPIDGWAVTFGTVRRDLDGLRPRPDRNTFISWQTNKPDSSEEQFPRRLRHGEVIISC